jgi:hypothetical protein
MLRRRVFGGQGREQSGSRQWQRRFRRPALERLEQREVLSQIVPVGGTTYELAINGDANEVLKYNGSSWTPITGTNTSVSQLAGRKEHALQRPQCPDVWIRHACLIRV